MVLQTKAERDVQYEHRRKLWHIGEARGKTTEHDAFQMCFRSWRDILMTERLADRLAGWRGGWAKAGGGRE